MASYKQTNSWREDGYGEVGITFVVSDTYEGLFLSATEANIFELEDVATKLSGTVGGTIESELKLQVDEAKIKTTTDIAAKDFITAAISATNKRFCGVFVVSYNSGTGLWSSPSSDNMMFNGLIQTEIESEEFEWGGSDYDTAITPSSIL